MISEVILSQPQNIPNKPLNSPFLTDGIPETFDIQLPFQGFNAPTEPIIQAEEGVNPYRLCAEQGWQANFLDASYPVVALAMNMEHALKNFQDQKNHDKDLKAELYKDFRTKRRILTRDASDPVTLNCNRTFMKLRNAWQEDETLHDLFEEEAFQVLVDKKAEYFFTPTSIVFIHEYRGLEKK